MVKGPQMCNSRLAMTADARQSGAMFGWLRTLHQWVVGGEAWAAAYSWLSEHLPKIWEWVKEHWWSLLAMASTRLKEMLK